MGTIVTPSAGVADCTYDARDAARSKTTPLLLSLAPVNAADPSERRHASGAVSGTGGTPGGRSAEAVRYNARAPSMEPAAFQRPPSQAPVKTEPASGSVSQTKAPLAAPGTIQWGSAGTTAGFAKETVTHCG